MKNISRIALMLACFTMLAVPAFADPFTWTEAGSAGNLPGTANITTGAGPLQMILGNLLDVTEVDMFQIMISDFLNFSARTLGGVLDVNDPQLFLFDALGRAVYMNDDDESGFSGSQSMLPTGSVFGPTAAGLYYLAIGWFDNEPFSAAGRMFEDGIGTNGPGIGGASAITSWNNDAIGRPDLPTAYSIQLTGASFAVTPVPEPSTLVLLGSGLTGVIIWRRRSRKG